MGKSKVLLSKCMQPVASFLGPTQLSVTCSTEKEGESCIFSHMSIHNRKMAKSCRTNKMCFAYFQQTTHTQCFVCTTVSSCFLDTCGKLPGTLALVFLAQWAPHTIRAFLPSLLSWHHSCEKRYQAFSCFSPSDGKLGAVWERGWRPV